VAAGCGGKPAPSREAGVVSATASITGNARAVRRSEGRQEHRVGLPWRASPAAITRTGMLASSAMWIRVVRPAAGAWNMLLPEEYFSASRSTKDDASIIHRGIEMTIIQIIPFKN
jgi:hypothetical protein